MGFATVGGAAVTGACLTTADVATITLTKAATGSKECHVAEMVAANAKVVGKAPSPRVENGSTTSAV